MIMKIFYIILIMLLLACTGDTGETKETNNDTIYIFTDTLEPVYVYPDYSRIKE